MVYGLQQSVISFIETVYFFCSVTRNNRIVFGRTRKKREREREREREGGGREVGGRECERERFVFES